MSSYLPGGPEGYTPEGFFPGGTGGGGGSPLYPVWPLNPQLTMQMAKRFANVRSDFGGNEIRANKNQAYVHADGQGGVTAHKGRWEFQIQFTGIDQTDVYALWNFITARLGPIGAFYFYNPIEAPIDLTGSSTTGRYLVRLKDSIVSLEAFALKLHRGSISLIEVRA